jgi:hypothetical protein
MPIRELQPCVRGMIMLLTGKGISSALVKDVLLHCMAGARMISGRAVVVQTIDVEAESYWQS